MNKELIIKSCEECGTLIKVIKDNNCITCCNKKMIKQVANTNEASAEKHLPVCKVIDNKIYVVVNHVMDEEHFIEWVSYITEDKEETVYVKDKAEVTFDYVAKGTIYSYCNKHGLWKTEIN